MKRNVGNMDRAIRIIVGLGILSLTYWGPKTAWGFLGLVPLITGFIGWCPPYAVFGVSTCHTDRRQIKEA